MLSPTTILILLTECLSQFFIPELIRTQDINGSLFSLRFSVHVKLYPGRGRMAVGREKAAHVMEVRKQRESRGARKGDTPF